jgi:hypothetical protein
MPWPTQIRTTTCTNSCLCVAIFLISPAGARPLRAVQKGAEKAAPAGTRSLRSRRRAGRAAADGPTPHWAATGRVPGRSTEWSRSNARSPSPFSRGRRIPAFAGTGRKRGWKSFLHSVYLLSTPHFLPSPGATVYTQRNQARATGLESASLTGSPSFLSPRAAPDHGFLRRRSRHEGSL